MRAFKFEIRMEEIGEITLSEDDIADILEISRSAVEKMTDQEIREEFTFDQFALEGIMEMCDNWRLSQPWVSHVSPSSINTSGRV